MKGDTVDNLVREYNLNPGFIKIDAEGAECLVFSGALGTIKKYKPVIISELSESLLANFGETSETIFKFLSRKWIPNYQSRIAWISCQEPIFRRVFSHSNSLKIMSAAGALRLALKIWY